MNTLDEARYPPWTSVQLPLKEKNSEQVLIRAVGPLRSKILNEGNVRLCAWEYFEPLTSYYLFTDMGENRDGDLYRYLKKAASLPEFRRWFEKPKAEPYRAIDSNSLGGPEVVETLLEVLHHYSEVCLALAQGSIGKISTNRSLFALLGTLAILDALPLSAEEKIRAIQENIRLLARRANFRPDPKAWRSSIRTLENYRLEVRAYWTENGLPWEVLARRLSHFQISLLRDLHSRISSLGERLSPSKGAAWTAPYFDVIGRRIVHPFWGHVGLGIFKEIIWLAFLEKTILGSQALGLKLLSDTP